MKYVPSSLGFKLFRPFLLAAATTLLISCAAPPSQQPQLLSRLPASHPDAAPAVAPWLNEKERARYSKMDKLILDEQNRSTAKQQRPQRDYSPPLPSPYFYTGYRNGLRSGGWGMSYGPRWPWWW